MKNRKATSFHQLKYFKSLSAQLNLLLKKEEVNQTTLQQQKQISHQLRGLYMALRKSTGQRRLRRILAGAALVLGLGTAAQGQVTPNYPVGVANPFSLVPLLNAPVIVPYAVDIDGDGDLDVMVGETYGSINFFENIGTPQVAVYDTAVNSPFNLQSLSAFFPIPTFGDLDADGDLDMIAGDNYYGMYYYLENTGTATAPNFAAPVADTLGLTTFSYVVFPELVDLDADGDLDMFSGRLYGTISYFENVGDSATPIFAAPVTNPFGFTAGTDFVIPRFADLDQDGDLDLLTDEYYGAYRYFENIGSSTAPAFAPPLSNPFGLQMDNDYNVHCFGDFDADGDMDILEGELYGGFEYYENMPLVSNAPNFSLNALTIAPNPSNGPLRISYQSDALTEPIRLKVFSMEGRMLHEWETEPIGNRLQTEWDSSHLPSGIYLLEIDLGNTKMRKRFSRL